MISASKPLLLASGSPRRRELLEGIDVPIVTFPLDIDESIEGGESPEDYVSRIALKKLEAARSNLLNSTRAHSGILTADTTVVIDGCIVGKPVDQKDSLATIMRLCGRMHRVFTSYALEASESGELINRMVCTDVFLREASRSELEIYVNTGDGLDKAGAYSIQGRGGFLVERINGSYSNVVGLPLCELVVDMKSIGLLPE